MPFDAPSAGEGRGRRRTHRPNPSHRAARCRCRATRTSRRPAPRSSCGDGTPPARTTAGRRIGLGGQHHAVVLHRVGDVHRPVDGRHRSSSLPRWGPTTTSSTPRGSAAVRHAVTTRAAWRRRRRARRPATRRPDPASPRSSDSAARLQPGLDRRTRGRVDAEVRGDLVRRDRHRRGRGWRPCARGSPGLTHFASSKLNAPTMCSLLGVGVSER